MYTVYMMVCQIGRLERLERVPLTCKESLIVVNTQTAYSTDKPEVVAAYRQAKEAHNTFGARMRADVEALGAGPRVFLRGGGFGSPQRITALEQKGDHIPDGWRVVRGQLEPRRGKPGE